MIDLHCHLLPGIDDGPASMAEALALCRHAVASGITHSVVTPHVHPGRYANDAASIAVVAASLKRAVVEAGIPLAISFSGEVRISPEVMTMVEAGLIPFHGEWDGGRVMLLEFPHSHIPPGSDRLIRWLQQRGIAPMIAHPERNKDVMRDLARLHEFVDAGCLFQVTAGSLAGRFGGVAEERACEIVQAGWATVLASDAHNLGARPPELADGLAVAVELVGENAAMALVMKNPWHIVAQRFEVVHAS